MSPLRLSQVSKFAINAFFVSSKTKGRITLAIEPLNKCGEENEMFLIKRLAVLHLSKAFAVFKETLRYQAPQAVCQSTGDVVIQKTLFVQVLKSEGVYSRTQRPKLSNF